MSAAPGSMRLVADGGTCTLCGAEVAVSLEGLGALSQEEAFAEIERQVAVHNAACPAKDAPPTSEARADG